MGCVVLVVGEGGLWGVGGQTGQGVCEDSITECCGAAGALPTLSFSKKKTKATEQKAAITNFDACMVINDIYNKPNI